MNRPVSNQILVLEDEDAMRNLLVRMAIDVGFAAEGVSTTAQFVERCKELRPSVVALDIFLQSEDVGRAIDALAHLHFGGAVILISGFDYRLIRAFVEIARDNGLHVLGVVEKGKNVGKFPHLLKSAFLGPLHAVNGEARP